MKPGDANEMSVALQVQPHDHAPAELCFTVTVTTPRLNPYPRSLEQLDLLRRAVALRELEGLTFAAIAKRLSDQGYKGARGAALTPEGVFALIKKGKPKQPRSKAPSVPSGSK
jgi:hypothetical protein